MNTKKTTQNHWLTYYIFHYCSQPIPDASFFNSVNVQPLSWFMNIQKQNLNHSFVYFFNVTTKEHGFIQIENEEQAKQMHRAQFAEGFAFITMQERIETFYDFTLEDESETINKDSSLVAA